MSASIVAELGESLKGGRPVMRAPFEEYSVESVLHALSLSRQFTGVELYDRNQRLAGRVYLKSGMVLAVEAPGLEATGLEAFQQLMRAPLGSYSVYRLPPLATYPFPIGRLSTSLLSTTSRPSETAAPPAAAVAPALPKKVAPAPAPPRVVPAPQPAAGPPIVAVSSPKGGCGKTTICLNLAVSLARQGLRVVLVDVDPNGDVLSAIAARHRVQAGAYEAAMGGHDAMRLLLRTVVPGLSILPSMGPEFALEMLEPTPSAAQWRGVLRAVSGQADVIIVDTPAGVLGVTAAVLQASTHVIGVLQAEVISKRSFTMFQRGLDALGAPPKVLGVVLNMFQRSAGPSVSVFTDALSDLPAEWLFDTTIPRAPDFLSSSDAGMPLRPSGDNGGSAVAFLFDMLAGEVRSRLGLAAPSPADQPTSFLL